MPLDRTESCARRLDGEDQLARFREPDILRVAPVPLYNRFLDVYRFVQVLEEIL
jgi:kynureninase